MTTYLRIIWTDDPDSFADAAYINIESLKEDNVSILVVPALNGFDVVAYNGNNPAGDILAHFLTEIAAMRFCEKLLEVLGCDIIDLEDMKEEARKCEPAWQHS